MTATDRKGPLSGYTVLDLTTMVMGPMATQILGDLGARVIKVERPEGDPQRYPLPSRHPTMNGVFLNLNRNKQSLAVDLKSEEGQTLLLKLCAEADVVVNSLRRESARRVGLDYDSVRKVKPDIVYCSAYGFGEGGAYAGKSAYDDVIQAASGLSGLLQLARGEAGYLPIALCDKVSGLTMVYAIIAGLLHRERTGAGQEIEMPMFESNVAFNLIEHVCGHVFEPPLGPYGWTRILSPYRKPFRTKDGYACILPYSDKNWADFFAAIGQPELMADPRYSTHTQRIQNTDTLYQIIEANAPARTNAEWMAFCDEAGIPAMPVLLPTDLWDDAHIKATGLLTMAEHPTEGLYRVIGPPVKFGASPADIAKHAPNIGEDSISLMRQAGLSEEEIADLLQRRIVRQWRPGVDTGEASQKARSA